MKHNVTQRGFTEGDNDILHPIGRPETDRERFVVIVNGPDGSGKLCTCLFKQGVGECRDLGRDFGD